MAVQARAQLCSFHQRAGEAQHPRPPRGEVLFPLRLSLKTCRGLGLFPSTEGSRRRSASKGRSPHKAGLLQQQAWGLAGQPLPGGTRSSPLLGSGGARGQPILGQLGTCLWWLWSGPNWFRPGNGLRGPHIMGVEAASLHKFLNTSNLLELTALSPGSTPYQSRPSQSFRESRPGRQ